MRIALAVRLFMVIAVTLLGVFAGVFVLLERTQARQWEDHLREQSLAFARFATPELLKIFRGGFGVAQSEGLAEANDFLGFNRDLVEFGFFAPSGRLLFQSPRFPDFIDFELPALETAATEADLAASRPSIHSRQLPDGRLLEIFMPAFGPTGQHLFTVAYRISTDVIDRRLAEMRRGFLHFGLAMLTFALVLVALLARGITRPVRALTAAARAFAREEWGTRIPVRGRDEIATLAAAFNDMAASLERNRRDLLAMQQQLLRNERLAVIGQLAAGVSHEIDNPVGVILGRAELLLDDLPPDDPRREDVTAIIEECRRCRRITGGLLGLARGREGRREPVEVRELVQGTFAYLAPQQLFRQVRLECDLPDDLPPLRGDLDQLRQVLVNLLLNAAQAMEGRGEIHLSAVAREGMVQLDLVDSGPGVPQGMEEQIFDPFFTSKASGAGTGLGLAICRKLVQEHGGQLTLIPGTNRGARFRLSLPLVAAEKRFDKDRGAL